MLTDAEFIELVGKEVVEIVKAKNQDYGNSFEQLIKRFGSIALVIRFHDKLNRLESLTLKGQEQQVSDESVEDTLKDIAGYALLSLAMMHKKRSYEQL